MKTLIACLVSAVVAAVVVWRLSSIDVVLVEYVGGPASLVVCSRTERTMVCKDFMKTLEEMTVQPLAEPEAPSNGKTIDL